MDIQAMVAAGIKAEFIIAAEEFSKNPTGDAFLRLESAMWARQAITSKDTMDKALPVLEKIGIGHWVYTLRDIHKKKES